MPLNTDEVLEKMVQTRRGQRDPAPEKPSELLAVAKEMRHFASVVTEVLSRPEPATTENQPAQPVELSALLGEMKRFNSAVVAILSKPNAPQTITNIPSPPPTVHVAAPNVELHPNIRVEQPVSRFRITVESRDIHQRAKTYLIEPI